MQLKDISPTNLITSRIKLQKRTKVYNAKHKKLSQDREWWLRRIIKKRMNVKIYKRTVTANSSLSRWNTNSVLIPKPDQV